jgi:hypothetical protein
MVLLIMPNGWQKIRMEKVLVQENGRNLSYARQHNNGLKAEFVLLF